MKAQVLKGSKEQIADDVIRIRGEVREAIIFVDEPTDSVEPSVTMPQNDTFAEMQAFMVNTDGADCSREAIYSPVERE